MNKGLLKFTFLSVLILISWYSFTQTNTGKLILFKPIATIFHDEIEVEEELESQIEPENPDAIEEAFREMEVLPCPITLTSAAGTINQSVCEQQAIVNITYEIIGATNVIVTSLPAGITFNYSSNILTISGTPDPNSSVGSPYTYSIEANGGSCNGTGTITVAAPANAGSLSGIQDVCVGGTQTFYSTVLGGSWSTSNSAIATVNPSTGVVTGVAAGTATINYTVPGTGGCADATATRTVTVTAPPSAGTLGGDQAVCIGGTSTFASTIPGGTWTTNNAAIATVNPSTGLVTGD
ncbi:Ig-like domain-containing protein, partial [Algoriphagus sp. AK58]|uniref:Ig-like domain-containing protein n=1 Tax=Algoriphagus sp. AK58 TaxID=1406877 RepID=UPI001650D1D5